MGGVTVVDDYAHNPGKVAAVVATAAEIAHARGGHLRVIFQPHLYSRTNDFATDFALALAAADDVVLLEIYGAREEPVPGVGSHLVADALLIEIGGTGGKAPAGRTRGDLVGACPRPRRGRRRAGDCGAPG